MMGLLPTITLLWQFVLSCYGFSLFSNNQQGSSKTLSLNTQPGEFFHRIKNYETTYIKHNQFHKIDQDNPSYPTNGKFEFTAFNRTYEIWFRKHLELFHPNFKSVLDDGYQQYDKSHDICHYIGEVTNDPANNSIVTFSACKGRGVRAVIDAFGETLILEPTKLHTDANYGRNHRIDDEYLAYKGHEFDTSDWAGDCGHGYDPDKKHSHKHGHDHGHHDHHDHDHEHDHGATGHQKPPRKKSLRQKLTRGTRENKRKNRRLTSETTQYVELVVVNDPGRVQKYKNSKGDNWYDELVDATVDTVSTVNTRYYDTDWGDDVGTIQIVLSQIVMWHNWTGSLATYKPNAITNSDATDTGECPDSAEPSLFSSSSLGDSDYCEAEYDDYLSKFQSWRQSSLAPDHDNAQLLSYYDFYQSVIGYAALPGMCFDASSGGINQGTYSDTYNANIMAHEMGHNFYMSHDSSGNTCDGSTYIMAASASPYGYTPTSFSTCSIDYVDQYFGLYPSTLDCLSNEPYETEYAVCGNGFVEQGESCDCGSSDCSASDKCCDGSTCVIYSNYECSNDDDCCNDCVIKSSGSVCRELDEYNSCDIEVEYCDGQSSECPSDTHYNEGTACSYDDINADGLCYNAECKSIDEQCDNYESFYGDSGVTYDICSTDESNDYTTDTCGDINCQETSGGNGNCNSYDETDFEDGTPCRGCSGSTCQCDGSSCRDSTSLYTYKWTTSGWSTCSKECKDDSSEDAGVQTRSVNCTFQDGTPAPTRDDCDSSDEPQASRECNDYLCTFCEGYDDPLLPCGEHGTCVEASGSCECDNGYDGSFCDVVPGLTWKAITRRVINNGSVTISYRADPCDRIAAQYDGIALTVPIDAYSLTNLHIGETIYVRWNSSGAIDDLAVGLEALDGSTTWPVYVGDSLATDNSDCDSKWLDDGNGTITNNTDYDGCFVNTDCDDFSFEITSDFSPGLYRIVVRFSNDYIVYSEDLNVSCSESYCNAAGHGSCGSDGTCVCDTNWYGDACDTYNCSDWSFTAQGDAFTATELIDKCYDGDTCDPTASDLDDLCDCGIHYEGTYCEVPIDGCSGLSDCNDDECTLDGTYGCVYEECFVYDEDDCGTWETNSSTICEWNGNYCERITCSGLAECQNGAVRRNLNDGESMCDSWYCDCDTVTTEDSYWTVSSISTLSDSNYSTNVGIFTCSQCSLTCSHGSDPNDDCTACSGCDTDVWGGYECNKVQWIVSFKVNIEWDVAAGSDAAEYNALIVQDLAYLLDVSTSKIEVWQLKGDSDGYTIVYFKYIFETTDSVTAQSTGGDLFINMRELVSTEGSTAYRGFVMGETDSSYTLEYCIPEKEECDPDAQFDFAYWFFVCLGSSYGFEVLVVIIYRFATSRRRQRKYEEKVREVRKAQLRLMEHHQKARRVGMRDVSKHRAAKIHHEKEKVHKQEVAEARRRSKAEAEDVKRRRGSSQASHASAHNKNVRSEVEFQQQNPNRLSTVSGSGRGGRAGSQFNDNIPSQSSQQQQVRGSVGEGGAFAAGDFERPLPPGWTMYLSQDGIPYYYNAQTGETSWRHPLDPNF